MGGLVGIWLWDGELWDNLFSDLQWKFKSANGESFLFARAAYKDDFTWFSEKSYTSLNNKCCLQIGHYDTLRSSMIAGVKCGALGRPKSEMIYWKHYGEVRKRTPTYTT